MKKLFLIVLIVPLLSFCYQTTTNNFTGRWAGNEKGQVGFINFDTNGFVEFEINGEILGGKEFIMKGEKHQMIYEIDQTKDPIEVDLIMVHIASQEQKKLPGIAKFITKDKMVFAMAFEGDRPTNFTQENSINLKKVE